MRHFYQKNYFLSKTKQMYITSEIFRFELVRLQVPSESQNFGFRTKFVQKENLQSKRENLSITTEFSKFE